MTFGLFREPLLVLAARFNNVHASWKVTHPALAAGAISCRTNTGPGRFSSPECKRLREPFVSSGFTAAIAAVKASRALCPAGSSSADVPEGAEYLVRGLHQVQPIVPFADRILYRLEQSHQFGPASPAASAA